MPQKLPPQRLTNKPQNKPEDYVKPKARKPQPKPPPKARTLDFSDSDEDQPPKPRTHLKPPPSMACGGKVKSTGLYKLHKGEMVLPKDVVNKIKSLKNK